jgi:acetoin utilization protein AcuB
MSPRTVDEFMTYSPRSIGASQSLAEAHQLMRDNRIRHLPVLAGGALVGLVSERDLHLLETLQDVDPRSVAVDEAMSERPLTVAPEAALAPVVEEMWRRKLGSAVVVKDGRVVGMFTTNDALRALFELLSRGRREAVRRKPRSARRRSPR